MRQVRGRDESIDRAFLLGSNITAWPPLHMREKLYVAPVTFPVWLTTHRELHTSQRIRVVFDALAEGLTAYR